MEQNNENRSAIVTGASRGIGRATAIALAEKGYSVVVNYSKDEYGAEEVRKTIEAAGGRAFVYKADVSDESEAKALVSFCAEQSGRLDVCVNNAGISLWGQITDFSAEDIEKTVGTNLTGTVFVSKYASEIMVRQKSGCIINVSSMWGEAGASCETVYSASKAGVIGFTKALAKELAPSGIRVNCVSPGAVYTDMMSSFSQSEIEDLIKSIPLGRLGTPKDVANAILFLASESSSYITGYTLSVNGGMIM